MGSFPEFLMTLAQNAPTTAALTYGLSKLAPILGNQIVLTLDPWHKVRNADADASVKSITAKSEQEVRRIHQEMTAEMTVSALDLKQEVRERKERALLRSTTVEEKRQENIEAIVVKAAACIGAGHNGCDEPEPESVVEPDWIARFLDDCKDVSNEQMQEIWAKMLAGEVHRPGTFSLRTLNAVRTLSAPDARLFTRFCTVIWTTNGQCTPIIPNDEVLSLPGINLTTSDLLRLEEAQLIRIELTGKLEMTLSKLPRDRQSTFEWDYHGIPQTFIFGNKDSDTKKSKPKSGRTFDLKLEIGKAMTTAVGSELAPISGATPNEEYRKAVIHFFRMKGLWLKGMNPAQ